MLADRVARLDAVIESGRPGIAAARALVLCAAQEETK
jgi:hypothetical protein